MSDFKSELLSDLDRRGLVKDCSDASSLDELLSSGRKITVYAGFDPTADSLHVGHLVSLITLRRFLDAGHAVVPVIGTATAAVGDPTGRSTARPILDFDHLASNAVGIERSVRSVLGEGQRVSVKRNGDWFAGQGFVEFLRDVGSVVPVGRMLGLESVRSRLGADGDGISFLEFSYSLMQAYDFLRLAWQFPDIVQLGGSDQWGNITMGLDLIARRRGVGRRPVGAAERGHAVGLTHPLLTRANGEKMGKSAGNAVWLNADRLSDFEFFRFWRTLDDADVVRVAKMFSKRSVEEIERDAREEGPALERLKEDLAVEMTALVRGAAAADAARAGSRSRGKTAEGLPEISASAEDLGDLPALLVKTGLAETKSAARRLFDQGGLRINGEKAAVLAIGSDDIKDGVVVLSAGKTKHAAVRVA